jgi:hypothetical protein
MIPPFTVLSVWFSPQKDSFKEIVLSLKSPVAHVDSPAILALSCHQEKYDTRFRQVLDSPNAAQ